jgi:hypothetical protein
MLRSSLLIVICTFGMLACSKEKASIPAGKSQPKETPNTRTIEKAAKPSPYKPKGPRQVTVVNRESVPAVRSAAARDDRPQSE